MTDIVLQVPLADVQVDGDRRAAIIRIHDVEHFFEAILGAIENPGKVSKVELGKGAEE